MRHIYKKIALGIAIIGFVLGLAPAIVAAGPFLTAVGGTGTSTPSGIMYGDNGATSHLNTLVIGSNLTLSGGTLSASGGSAGSQAFTFGTLTFSTSTAATTTSIWTQGVFFSSSTVAASQFPYASSTMLSATNGIGAYGSSTIGGGLATNGLTVNGGATSTGFHVFGTPGAVPVELQINNQSGSNGSDALLSFLTTGRTTPMLQISVLRQTNIGLIDMPSGDNLEISSGTSHKVGIASSTPWRTLDINGTVGMKGLTTGAGAGSLCLTANNEVVFNSGANCVAGGAGTVTSIVAGTGLAGGTITNSGTINLLSYIATSSQETGGTLAYWTSTNGTPATQGKVATGTVAASGNVSVTAGQSIIGTGLTVTVPWGWLVLNNFSTTTQSTSTSITAYSFFSSSTQASQFPYASTTAITATNASTSALTVSNVVSALHLASATGIVSAYGGSSGVCTNQFPTSMSALGALGTCTSVTDAFISGTITVSHTDAKVVSGSCSGGTVTCSGTNPLAIVSAAWEWTPSTIFGTANTSATSSAVQITGGLSASSTVRFGNAGVAFQWLWDPVNGREGIGSTTPTVALSIGTTGSSYGSIACTENDIATSVGTSTGMTIDWKKGCTQLVRTGTAAFKIGFDNASTSGQTLKLIVCNPGATAGALTWITQIEWLAAPTQTTTASKCDIYTFIKSQATSTVSAGGIIIGSQNAVP